MAKADGGSTIAAAALGIPDIEKACGGRSTPTATVTRTSWSSTMVLQPNDLWLGDGKADGRRREPGGLGIPATHGQLWRGHARRQATVTRTSWSSTIISRMICGLAMARGWRVDTSPGGLGIPATHGQLWRGHARRQRRRSRGRPGRQLWQPNDLWLGDGKGMAVDTAPAALGSQQHTSSYGVATLDKWRRSRGRPGRQQWSAECLWLGDGQGGWRVDTSPAALGIPANTGSNGAATLDANGDGHADVLVVNSGQPNDLWLGDGKAGGASTQPRRPGDHKPQIAAMRLRRH